jgi:hypothetical protein
MTEILSSPIWTITMSIMIILAIGTVISTKSKKIALSSKIGGSFCFISLLGSIAMRLNLL